ncbi:hypothetical protein A1O3_09443 [Capronia epimyces CBS 606.96]|uniref:Uncharacterized protein n=1 Tax=Capronia epimyces CBS 606.96 TaxID=1182542 RepID=W9XCR4_9EURO|nr:uncharacterized protein A1O3_09443 [Capronia epimyces CBS 606.96]EXJ78282.1 hypothetical protein A1O3_09443 [Capronia epimyces CBS 606.96]
MSDPAPPTRSSIFSSRLSPTLHTKLATARIPVDSLSRTAPSRLEQTALPNIGLIELVSAADFTRYYDRLYTTMFPRRAERERSDLIVDRLTAQARGERVGLAPYRIVGIRDPVSGEAIGAAHFSVLPLPSSGSDGNVTCDSTCKDADKSQDRESGSSSSSRDGQSEASNWAVPYLQYIYVRPQNRRQDMSEVLHTMILAVAAADAAPHGRTVPFTLFETEPPDHGDDTASRAYARERSKIHTSTGGLALMLRKNDHTGHVLSAHVQPGLEPDDPPLTLVWVIRQSPNPGRPYHVNTIGKHLIAAYYQSLRDEGFPEENINLAERMVEARCTDSVFHLMPLGEVTHLSGHVYCETETDG